MEKRSAALVAFGRSVRHHRNQLGISQERLALACGICRSYMGKVERGEVNLSFMKVVQITEGLGTTLESVMCRFERELELATELAEHNEAASTGAAGKEQ